VLAEREAASPAVATPQSEIPARKSYRALWVLPLAVALFFLFEGLVFRSGLYSSVLSTDSSAGYVETLIRNERLRVKRDPNQALGVGDSRMALRPKMSNELTAETGYTFASIGLGGTNPRCWYYMLRALEPAAGRYAAVVIPLIDYIEEDQFLLSADAEADLHYLIARLRLTDIPDFAGSYLDPVLRRRVVRDLIFKGLTYKRDFADLLLHPVQRYKSIMLSREGSAGWIYNYTGPNRTMEGLSIDWAKREAAFSPRMTKDQIDMVNAILLRPEYPQTGRERRYRRYWIGRILELYRGTRTKVILLRLPRGPVVRPPVKPYPGPTLVEELASHPNVIVLDEHLFDGLERPEYFVDAMHMNDRGVKPFSHILARQVRIALGPPRSAH
jgi:hypothetical protein